MFSKLARLNETIYFQNDNAYCLKPNTKSLQLWKAKALNIWTLKFRKFEFRKSCDSSFEGFA